MNIEEKKVLAQWMGWKDDYGHNHKKPDGEHWHKSKPHTTKNRVYIDDFNPDTDPKQFAEVLRKFEESNFSEKQVKIMNESFRGLNPKNDAYFTIYLCVADNMSKVMQAVLEVIKGG